MVLLSKGHLLISLRSYTTLRYTVPVRVSDLHLWHFLKVHLLIVNTDL